MRRRLGRRRKKKGLIERLEANLTAALAAQVASAPSTPALASSWRPLEQSSVGMESRRAADDGSELEEGVTAGPTAVSANTSPDAGYSDEDGPRWPDESEEAAVLGGRAASGPATIREQMEHAVAQQRAEEAEAVRDLPNIDDLVAKLPQAVRDGLEDLFRAKFTKVRRLPKREFHRQPDAG